MWAPTVVAPLVIGLLWKGAPKAAGIAGILAGAAGAALWEWGLGNPYGVPSLVAGLAANQTAFWAVAFTYRQRRSA
jgi:Na+/proline symporter